MSRPYYYTRRNSSGKQSKKIDWKWWLVIVGVLGVIWYLSSEELNYDPQVIELDVEDRSDEE